MSVNIFMHFCDLMSDILLEYVRGHFIHFCYPLDFRNNGRYRLTAWRSCSVFVLFFMKDVIVVLSLYTLLCLIMQSDVFLHLLVLETRTIILFMSSVVPLLRRHLYFNKVPSRYRQSARLPYDGSSLIALNGHTLTLYTTLCSILFTLGLRSSLLTCKRKEQKA